MKYTALFILLAITCCNSQMEQLKSIKEAKDIHILLLSETENNDAEEDENYVRKRQILKEVKLNEDQKKEFIKKILEKDNYEPLTRKCKFEPVYALRVDDNIYATFDVTYCPTLEYTDELGEITLLGIKTNNSLIAIVKEIMDK